MLKRTEFFISKRLFLYGIFIFLIILGRMIFLDADLPRSPRLVELFSIDEGFYTQSAFNLYNYRTLTHNVVPYITGDAGIANLFQTILTYISLLIFGNNYYGVRMPSVFISLITIWLFYLTLRNIKEDNSKFTNYSVFFMVLYFVTDFEYLSISRIYVPTVFRIFFITLMIYIFSRYYKKTYKEIFTYRNIFFFSFLSMSSIFFIYIYNIFIYSAVVFTIFIVSLINNWKDNKKQIVNDSFFIILASLFSALLFIIYLKLIYNLNIYEYTKLILKNEHSEHIIFNLLKENPFKIFRIIWEAIKFDLSTNIFRFNLSLLLLYLTSLPIFIFKLFKRANIFNIFIISLNLFLFLQTIFENTYYHKRLTIILPIVLIIILKTYKDFKKIYLLKNKIYKIFIFFYFVLILFFVLYTNHHQNIDNRIFGALSTPDIHGYNGNLTLDIIILNLLILILIFFYLLAMYRNNNSYFPLLIIIIPNIIMSFKFTYIYPTFYNKDTIIKMSPLVNNKITVGTIAFSYRFYNDSIPLLNPYNYMNDKNKYSEKLNKLFNEKKEVFIIQSVYGKDLNVKYTNNSHLNLEKLFYSGNGLYILLIRYRR